VTVSRESHTRVMALGMVACDEVRHPWVTHVKVIGVVGRLAVQRLARFWPTRTMFLKHDEGLQGSRKEACM
jgi:hypothetical protein